MNSQSRRHFLATVACGGAGLVFLPSLARAKTAPLTNGRIQIAQIGCGRMGTSDMTGVMQHPQARIVAVCDLDSKRLAIAKAKVEEFYQQKGEKEVAVQTYHDYHDVLARKDIDAVIVSTPDHWHALVAIEAALAGKHLYVQKPVTYNIAEAIALRKAVRARGVILQTGSQQRSEHPWSAFRTASEMVRNGRLGKLKTIRIGIGLDNPSGKPPVAMKAPANLDYERWLGSAPGQPYMEGRVHPQRSVDGRPGWITTEDFGLGMITNWGAHHIDIAHWAMGQELSGPGAIEASAEFMQNDLWTVHYTYHVEMQYPNSVQVILDNKFETGLKFEGEDGWIFCTRGAEKVTQSDANLPSKDTLPPLRASDPKLLEPLGSNAVRWAPSTNHYLNWLESIAAHRDPIAPIEHSARSLEACAAAWIAMKLKRKLVWNPAKECFDNSPEANALLTRKARKKEYDFAVVMQKAGLA
jgi:predicted dehydrogenase